MEKAKSILKSKTFLLVLTLCFILIFEQNGLLVEKYYYGFLYPVTSHIQRVLTKWIPFSIGDILYTLVAFYIIYKLIVFTKKVFSSANKILLFKSALIKLFNIALTTTIVFKLLWGLNYSRAGAAYQFKLNKYEYTKDELETFLYDLIFDANYCRKQIADTSLPQINIDTVFAETKSCYSKMSRYYPFLQNKSFTIKKSLFSKAGSYMGYTGYYNPFTGEAQVRGDLPTILLPAIACHEVAHQLGYASEEEANFIGYLVCNESNNILFRYSLDLDLIDYVESELLHLYINANDINGLKKYLYQRSDCYSKQVKKDRRLIRDFFFKDRKKVADISNFAYDKYLKLNHQANGIKSYNEVIGWLLAYKKMRGIAD